MDMDLKSYRKNLLFFKITIVCLSLAMTSYLEKLKIIVNKVAASLFDALAGQIGADPKDLESIDFDYLDATLDDKRQKQVELLLQLEKQKPASG
jgi:hypothetical protein